MTTFTGRPMLGFSHVFTRMASSVPDKNVLASTQRVADQLLPPIPLYRRLLRVHRKALPIEMRLMGDGYVKAEFRRTRSTDNPLHVVGFLSEWKKYLDYHEQSVADKLLGGEKSGERQFREGQKLQETLFAKLSADQIGQLYELLQATKQIYKDPSELTAEDTIMIPDLPPTPKK